MGVFLDNELEIPENVAYGETKLKYVVLHIVYVHKA